MQRWIAVGVVAAMLLFGGGVFAYHTYKQNRPAPIWVPMPINPQLDEAKRDEIAKNLKEKLSDHALLVKVSKDVKLAAKWKLASDEEGANEIGRRLFVKIGEADTQMGRVPSINIGVTGKKKETKVSGEIAMRLMDDVWKILGVKPPPKPGK